MRAIVLDPAGRIALVRHSYVARWHLPGGGVTKGERVEAAAIREVREESGAVRDGRTAGRRLPQRGRIQGRPGRAVRRALRRARRAAAIGRVRDRGSALVRPRCAARPVAGDRAAAGGVARRRRGMGEVVRWGWRHHTRMKTRPGPAPVAPHDPDLRETLIQLPNIPRHPGPRAGVRRIANPVA
ncbi:NUDIX domain-containing protein [Sphingomonas sp. MMS24-JH45]